MIDQDDDELLAAYTRWCQVRDLSALTIRLRCHQLSALARSYPLTAVTHQDLIGYLASGAWCRETRRSLTSAFRTFFRWAHAAGYRCDDPAHQLPTVPQSPPAPRPVPERVFRRAWADAPTQADRLGLALGRWAGLRLSEMTRVHERDLDADLGLLAVAGKGGRHRVVPVGNDLAALIADVTVGGYAFPGRVGGPCSPSYLHTRLRPLLGEWSVHSLRHAFATAAYRNSRDLLSVSALLGHSDVSTTQRYVGADLELLRLTAAAAR